MATRLTARGAMAAATRAGATGRAAQAVRSALANRMSPAQVRGMIRSSRGVTAGERRQMRAGFGAAGVTVMTQA